MTSRQPRTALTLCIQDSASACCPIRLSSLQYRPNLLSAGRKSIEEGWKEALRKKNVNP